MIINFSMNLRKDIYLLFFFILFFSIVTKGFSQQGNTTKSSTLRLTTDLELMRYLPKKISAIPQTYSVNKLPFFCKMEAKLDKKVNIPVRFRLGTVELIDELEGKRRY